MLDVTGIRQDFPILHQKNQNGLPLAYLDNAATTQKPLPVIQRLQDYYMSENANIHRGIFSLAVRSTQAYEAARDKIQAFLNAADSREIILTSGTTDGINLVAERFAAPRLEPGDEILISAMEHHSNLIPWQQLCRKKGARLRIIPVDHKGQLVLDRLDQLLNERTRMLALVHISNTLGTINPVEEIISQAHSKSIPVLIDGAQSAAHYPIDVQSMDCDFFVFSGHKVFGPTGTGVLYGKKAHLLAMEPYRYGGEMIKTVSFGESIFADLPQKFEAGTPNIAGAIALGAAIEYIGQIGKKNMLPHLNELLAYATKRLSGIEGLRIIGQAEKKSAILSFVMEAVHPHDIATILNEEGVAVRAGHHCTEPLMHFLGISGTVRASFSIYNTQKEIDQLAAALRQVSKIFNRQK